MEKHIAIFDLIASCLMPVFAQSFVPKLYATSRTQTSCTPTRSDVNPYTGAPGSRAHNYSTYSSDPPIHTGSQGGRYYINSRETYIPKRNRLKKSNPI